MDMPDSPQNDRRRFLSGESLRDQFRYAGDRIADELTQVPQQKDVASAETLRLTTRAMATEFAVMLNLIPSQEEQSAASQRIDVVSDALDLVHALEAQMTVYRDDSELLQINRNAYNNNVCVETNLYSLLRTAARIADDTEGGFDPTSGPLIGVWRACRQENRIPNEDEIRRALGRTGIEFLRFDDDNKTVSFANPHVEINLGGIGKGYALDRMNERLEASPLEDWLLHGGHSSVVARGDHNGLGGWPIGIKDPLFPQQRWANLILTDQAMSSSGTAVQSFRHDGKRYGHILDPRSGWPVEEMLSVTVVAPTAAEADALSTAFFVVGLEKIAEYCDNHPNVGAIVIPPPRQGRKLAPHVIGVDPDALIFPPES